LCPVDDFIIDIGYILDIQYLLPGLTEILCQYIKDHIGPCMTKMRIIEYRQTTDKERNPIRIEWLEWLDHSG